MKNNFGELKYTTIEILESKIHLSHTTTHNTRYKKVRICCRNRVDVTSTRLRQLFQNKKSYIKNQT